GGCSKNFTLTIDKEYEKEKINKVLINGQEIFANGNRYTNNNIEFEEEQSQRDIKVVVIPKYYDEIHKNYTVKKEPKEGENKDTITIPYPTGLEIVVSFEDWEEELEYIKVDGKKLELEKRDDKVYAKVFFNNLKNDEKTINLEIKPRINNLFEKNIVIKKGQIKNEEFNITLFPNKRKCYVEFEGNDDSLSDMNLNFLRTNEQFKITNDINNGMDISRITNASNDKSFIKDNQIDTLKFQVSCKLTEEIIISKNCYETKQVKLDFTNSNTQKINLSNDDWVHYGYVRFDYVDGDNDFIMINNLLDKPLKIKKGKRVSQKILLGNYQYEVSSKQKNSLYNKLDMCKKNDIKLINIASLPLNDTIEKLNTKDYKLNGGKSLISIVTVKDNIKLRFISLEDRVLIDGKVSSAIHEVIVPTQVILPSGSYKIQIQKGSKWKTIYSNIEFDINKSIMIDLDTKDKIITDISGNLSL
ncbi:MAG: hypothetical protein U9O56_01680, partial [Campylobacterota bacterium]|nr:hypothetical protein [Campylobacterota bacterium]